MHPAAVRAADLIPGVLIKDRAVAARRVEDAIREATAPLVQALRNLLAAYEEDRVIAGTQYCGVPAIESARAALAPFAAPPSDREAQLEAVGKENEKLNSFAQRFMPKGG